MKLTPNEEVVFYAFERERTHNVTELLLASTLTSTRAVRTALRGLTAKRLVYCVDGRITDRDRPTPLWRLTAKGEARRG